MTLVLCYILLNLTARESHPSILNGKDNISGLKKLCFTDVFTAMVVQLPKSHTPLQALVKTCSWYRYYSVPLNYVFGRAALWVLWVKNDHYSWWGETCERWQHDSWELSNLSDQTVTRSIRGRGKSFHLCRRKRGGKGGQLASTIRRPYDKPYTTAWDSRTNERGRGDVHQVGQTFQRHPPTLITGKTSDSYRFFTVP